MRFLRTLLYVFILSCGYGYCQPQIVVCDASTIKESLFGDGLEIENFQVTGFVCKYSGLDSFVSNNCDYGVILSTGNPSGIFSNIDIMSTGGNSFQDIPDGIRNLYNPRNLKLYDAAIIEFDFKLTGGCDGIFFNYVFASEEYPGNPPETYPGFVCSKYNDKFAFYYANAEKVDGIYVYNNYNNIATIPGTDISVEINSINNGICSYKSDNPDYYNPYPELMGKYTNLFVVQDATTSYNGHTVPLSASVKLSPGSTYHAYIIVADFSDEALDSGVFFKGKGIFGRKCPTISVQCEDGVSTLKVENESNNGTIISYQWLKNGQPIVGGTGDTYIAQDNSIYSVNITYEDGSFINVIAPEKECPTINVQCENGISTLKVENESNNGTIISYQWLKNGQPIVGGTGDTYIAQDNSIYSVNITYEDGSFINVIAPGKRCCPTGGITINGDVTEGSLSVCKDKVLDIGYTNSNQMTNPQYQWTFTDVSETYTSPNFSITAEKTGTLKLKVTSEECANTIELTTEIHVDLCVGTVCNDCPSRFSPTPGEKYTLSGWVSAEDQIGRMDSFEKVYILLVFNLIGSDTPDSVKCYPDGNIIDGWQRISKNFVIPQNAEKMRIALKNESSDNRVYFDDIRFHPFNASVKSYVYDPKTLRLAAELDDENYATFYEYDEEGALVRIKKETERGVMTIREARQSKPKNLGNGN